MAFVSTQGYLYTLDLKDMSTDLSKDSKWLAKMNAFFKLHDLNHDGYLTLEEILEFHVKRQVRAV